MAGAVDVWGNRRAVAQSVALLLVAQILVKTVSLARLRALLAASGAVRGGGVIDLSAARLAGRRVERAAMRVPWRTKCLPRAVATMWLLTRRKLAARLIIAVHRHDRSGEHAFHAWVEHGDEIVIGHCVRTDYAPLLEIGG